MKMNRLFFAIPLLLLLTVSCDRRKMPYTFETCSAFFAVKDTVDVPEGHLIKMTDKHWSIAGYDVDQDYVMMKYEGDAFVDACVSEATGMDVELSGNFMAMTAYVKVTDNDSFAIPLKRVLIGSDSVWTGGASGIDMKNYFLHYPGRMFPVVYAKVNYHYSVFDIPAAYNELNEDFKRYIFKPVGKRY